MVSLVWFKRDLRVFDHLPLVEALRRGPVLPLYIIEEAYWREPDTSLRQWRFIAECLVELHEELKFLGQGLVLGRGDVLQVLSDLHHRHRIAAVYSHQETGNAWTYARDRAVGAWLRERGIAWYQYPQNGVVRGLGSRDSWARGWQQRMSKALVASPERLPHVCSEVMPREWLAAPRGRDRSACPGRQRGGRKVAAETLEGFLNERGRSYAADLSSPGRAERSGSRLSPYIAHGVLSHREVVQATRLRLRGLASSGNDGWKRSLKAFQSRLYWHCHFMQKLEDQPDIEFRNLHRGYDGMRDDAPDREVFDAWAEGRTGLPFVDACMRMLWHEGWINFRMRAMLMAVASYHLWLHWREPALHLARLFVDYEPGIHYNQVQMQSGTTGINANRIYNPVKQSRDQDPHGSFIRRWVPELTPLGDSRIHEPWTLSAAEQQRLGFFVGHDYPDRLIDHEQASRNARDRLRRHRRGRDMRGEAREIQGRHGSRRSRGRARNARQRRLPL